LLGDIAFEVLQMVWELYKVPLELELGLVFVFVFVFVFPGGWGP
jgi:hypothetical protein